jgi:hypothetical protein
MYFRMTAAAVAAFVACISFAPDNSYAGAGRAIAHGAPAGASHRGRLWARHFRFARFGRWRNRHFGFVPYPLLWPDDCLVYDGCDQDGGASPGLPADWTGSLARAPAANSVAPNCRWMSQTQIVPAERGGQRKVTVTRCIAAPPLSASESEIAPSRSILRDYPESEETAGIGNRTDEPGDFSNRWRGCREQTFTVPSEAGGRRTVVIKNC